MQGLAKVARGSKAAAHEDRIAAHIILIIIHRMLYDNVDDGLGIGYCYCRIAAQHCCVCSKPSNGINIIVKGIEWRIHSTG